MTRGRLSWLAVVLTAVTAGGTLPIAAQQQPIPPDSSRAQILERLRRLDRPVGSDSALFVQDSLQRLAEAEASRSGFQSGPDSVVSVLSAMPGYTVTRYEGESADFEARDRILLLKAPEDGRATVSREGIQVQADSSITFNEQTGRMQTGGTATFTPPEGDPVTAENMVYDLGEGRGSARGASTEFQEGATRWFMYGDMPYAATDSTFMSGARFTSCELEHPHYYFETDQVKVVGGRVLVARGVRLYFDDVPVFWLPFMAQNLEQGRASGLLTPRFSVNDIVRTSQGHRRRISNVGFYWAMSDYTDALFALDWFSGTFTSLTTAFQYRVNSQFVNGNINIRRFWESDGGRQFAFDTSHDWQPDERTRANVSAQYAKSSFVREFSFDPREVTQQVTSTAGVNRRFDWGTLSVTSTRNQFLSDDRTTWDLPVVNLSLASRTLFPAPTSRARFYNNMTWGASSSFRRSTVDRSRPEIFTQGAANTVQTNASLSTNLSLGDLRLSPSVSFSESETQGVPEALIGLVPGTPVDTALLRPSAPALDIAQQRISWQTSIAYQQRLVGSTTLTPDLNISGEFFRSDTLSAASGFVAAPSRITLGATLKSDVYGFFPGFGNFETIRHKVTPSINYRWAPAPTPSELQRMVFGATSLRPRNVVSLTLNQTFEARRRQEDPDGRGSPGTDRGETEGADEGALPVEGGLQDGPRRVQQSPVTTLLGLQTSIITYDFVEADSTGSFLGGFQTPQLTNQITSDFLRGLSVTLRHDLWDDSISGGKLVDRRFAPHLAGANFGFSIGSNSGIVRWLSGLVGGSPPPEPDRDEGEDDPDAFLDDEDLLGESSMIPGGGTMANARGQQGPTRRSQSGVGEWNANLSYSLQRPRDQPDLVSQMLSGTVRLRPTENWDLSWRTAFDLEEREFSDHTVRLSRDLHRWQANFDFLQTATGNWSFRFEVSLSDNQDLRFDYQQRNLDVGLPAGGGS